MSSDLDQYKESHHILYQNAKTFYATASLAFSGLRNSESLEDEDTSAPMPVFYNLCMSIELALKSFLVAKGKNCHVHDLCELFEKCVKDGLWVDCLDRSEIEILELLGRFHMTKAQHTKRYPHEKPNFAQKLRYTEQGAYRLPKYFPAIELTIKILEQVKINCPSKIIEPNKFKPNEIINSDKGLLSQIKENRERNREFRTNDDMPFNC